METIRLAGESIEAAAFRAVAVLRAGGVILYPTDTLYGLGANAFSDEAVAKVYAIKGRDEKKPMHCIVADFVMAEAFGEMNDAARALAEQFLPGPLTLVVRKRPGFDTGIAKGITTIGIRMPRSELCLAIAKRYGPYTTTSANLAGAHSGRTVHEIALQLGLPAQANARAAKIDLAIDAGELPERKPSTVVDVSTGKIRMLREGGIAAGEIIAAARGTGF